MGSRKEMRDEIFTLFGTPFEELEESEAASKRPLSIENQIVTDEKGRRRFHGAFTGGFSAGYFNSVGTKEGWAPSTFKSTRAKRGELESRRAEDFMDSEDFSEYGIAPRRIQTTHQFREEAEQSTSSSDRKRRFAGEGIAEIDSISDRLSEIIKPVSDSIGARLMRSMGWRPGKGVGAEESVAVRERKAATAAERQEKVYGCEMPPGAAAEGSAEIMTTTSAAELEEMAPIGFRFAPSDVDFVKFLPKTDLHGLGYKGLDSGRFLQSAKNLEQTTAVKSSAARKKGIEGQAFGVGAFEDDDEDVYAIQDLSGYDYTLGGSDTQQKEVAVSNDFAPASKYLQARKFFPAPKLPRDYAPSAPTAAKVASSSSSSKQSASSTTESKRGGAGEGEGEKEKNLRSRNSVQRANAMGESHSVWSLVSENDRKRIEAIRQGKIKEEAVGTVKQAKAGREEVKLEKLSTSAAFPDDAKKRARYQDFVNYLKRGLCPPQPPDMTEWSWEIEQAEFRKLLPSDLIAAESDARARLKPLAGDKIASAFSNRFKSKFTKSALGEEESEGGSGQNREDEDKIKAVQMKMFGPMTREKHEWHPERNLCKRFNVPNPYPESRAVGIPYMKRDTKPDLFSFGFESAVIGVGETNDEKTSRLSSEVAAPESKHHHVPANRSIVIKDEIVEPTASSAADNSAKTASIEQEEQQEPQKPPMSLFKAVFAQTSSSESESEPEPEQEPKLDREETERGKKQRESGKPEPGPSTKDYDGGAYSRERGREEVIRRKNFEIFNTDDSESVVREETKSTIEEIDEEANTSNKSRDVEESASFSYGPALPPEISASSLPPTSVILRHKRDKKKKKHHHHKKKSKSRDRDKQRREDKNGKKKKKQKRSKKNVDTITISSSSSGEATDSES